MGLIICLFLSGVLVICDGLDVLGPSGPVIVELEGSVMMPCYVEVPIPLEELEVEWRRADSETLVHLFQDGESRSESQDLAYSGRASFFTEEVQRGNFSLLLTNLVPKDAGGYRCSVFRHEENGQTLAEIEFLIVTGGHAVSSYALEDVSLNCSVASRIPGELLEDVSWKKVDQDITVLVFQEGDVQTEFTHERFRDRVELFGPEEIHKGNFSLRIKDLKLEDKGLYRCEVLSGEFAANTTVEILRLGFSPIHYVILILGSCTCLCGLLLLIGCIPYTFCKGPGSGTVIIQHALIFCPNIFMCVAFILWGVLEGLIIVAATFLTINFLRIFWLLPFSPYLLNFQEKIQTCIRILSILEWSALSVITAVVFVLYGWRTQNKVCMGFAGSALVLSFIFILGTILLVILLDHKRIKDILMFCIGASLIRFSLDVGIVYFLSRDVIDTNGNKGLICLIVLTACCAILNVGLLIIYDKQSRSKNKTSPALIGTPFTLGVSILFLANPVILAVDLFRQAGEGEHIVEDLRLIFLPFEMVIMTVCPFAMLCCPSPRPVNQNTVL